MKARFHFHIRVAEVVDPDYEGIEIEAKDCIAEAVAIARRIVAEAIQFDEGVGEMVLEITDCEGRLVAELPFRCCVGCSEGLAVSTTPNLEYCGEVGTLAINGFLRPVCYQYFPSGFCRRRLGPESLGYPNHRTSCTLRRRRNTPMDLAKEGSKFKDQPLAPIGAALTPGLIPFWTPKWKGFARREWSRGSRPTPPTTSKPT